VAVVDTAVLSKMKDVPLLTELLQRSFSTLQTQPEKTSCLDEVHRVMRKVDDALLGVLQPDMANALVLDAVDTATLLKLLDVIPQLTMRTDFF
jgi:hypothetical protein